MSASEVSATGDPSAERTSGAEAATEAELETGYGHHQAGRLVEAEHVYRGVLASDPQHPVALHLLALLLNQRGEREAAIDHLQRSVAEDPAYAAAFYDLGNILRDLGRLDEAENALRQAAALWPDWPEAQYNYGLLLEARGNLRDAVAAFRAAVAAKPDYSKALLSLATTLRKQGQPAEAEAAHETLAAIPPESAEAHYHRGIALFELKENDAALESFDRAIALRPDYAEAYIDRGNALLDLKLHEAALASYEHAIALKPDFHNAHVNRGAALVSLQRYEAALASYERAVALAPESADVHYARGNALFDLQRHEAAVESYERAIALQPGHALACSALAGCRLQLGDFARGWEGFEWRLRVEGFAQLSPTNLPLAIASASSALAGKTVLLHGEQGLGDTLQFCRYAKPVAALGATVVLVVQPPLVRLLANVAGATLVLPYGTPLPASDYHCPLMSLPWLFGTDLATIPADIPYLHADPEDAARWSARIGDTPRLRVGLVWAGDARVNHRDANRIDRLRSVALAQFAPLAPFRDVRFYSLQKGAAAAQAKTPPPGMTLVDFTAELDDFADTAALVSQLDLVITVDTSVAHLAGALGVPVWVLSRYNGCWRWLLDRDDSPWYPSLRLFRQSDTHDWSEVMERVAAAFADFRAHRLDHPAGGHDGKRT